MKRILMKKMTVLCLSIASALMTHFYPVEAARKKPFTNEFEAEEYLTTYYNFGCENFNKENWKHAVNGFERVAYFFPGSEKGIEATYFLAVAFYNMREYDFANDQFSNYLKTAEHPVYFEDAINYKFCIAEFFKNGVKRRPFTNRYIFKCLNAHDLALTIYDEIIAAAPGNEITIQAMYSKAELLEKMRDYRASVEAYQSIIKRFPKEEITPICYVNIANVYVEQCRKELQNPDILCLAEQNAKKFAEEFPRDERRFFTEGSIKRIRELNAKGLYNLGAFYERKCQVNAAIIYYRTAIHDYPETITAGRCRARLLELVPEESVCVDETQSTNGNECCEGNQSITVIDRQNDE